jgi:hypothetical protein
MDGLNLFAHFIAELALSPQLLDRYLLDPETVMEEVGLNEEEKDVLRKGEFRIICKYLGGSGPRPITENQIGPGSGTGG